VNRMKRIGLIVSFFIVSASVVHGESFDNFDQAFQVPERVTRLSITRGEMKHLPPQLGTLIHLKELNISCLENLEDLPKEIGNLKELEKLIIDNGNGCQMNVSIPESIGSLKNLKVLRLYGALDPRGIDPQKSAAQSQFKALPKTIAKLQNLEELGLGRNGIKTVPPQIASLRNLKKLGLDYNDIHELPPFIGDLKNLKELSVRSNGGIRLPRSLIHLKGLKVFMGNNFLKLKDQKLLRHRFPEVIFSFENEYDDSAANEEAQK